MAGSGTWAPYTGVDAVELAVVLFLVGVLSAFLGTRLKKAIGTSRPGKTAAFLMITVWILSILTFLFNAITYGFVLEKSNLVGVYQSYTAPNPVSPITDLSAAVAFVTIVFLTWKRGPRLAVLSAFLGAAAGPLIFELPFDLIVLNRIYPPIPPSPILFRLLFFLPLFLIEISTFSLLTLSPLTRISKYTLFSLAGMFFLFALWALFGFSFPSDPLSTAFNDVSKVVGFVVAISLFWGGKGSGSSPEVPASSPSQPQPSI